MYHGCHLFPNTSFVKAGIYLLVSKNSSMVPRFLGVLIFSTIVIVVVSFLWPKFTLQPRPEPLSWVRSFVASTSVGPQIATVLGVLDEQSVESINMADAASQVANNITESTINTVQRLAFTRVATQLLRYYKNLSPEEQSYIQTAICQSPPVGSLDITEEKTTESEEFSRSDMDVNELKQE